MHMKEAHGKAQESIYHQRFVNSFCSQFVSAMTNSGLNDHAFQKIDDGHAKSYEFAQQNYIKITE